MQLNNKSCQFVGVGNKMQYCIYTCVLGVTVTLEPLQKFNYTSWLQRYHMGTARTVIG